MTMKIAIKPRHKSLSGLVRSIWCYQSNPIHDYEQIQPGTGTQLIFNLQSDELAHRSVAGTHYKRTGPVAIQGVLTTPVLIETSQKRNLCGVAFSSFGLTALCELNASRFTDTIVDASDVWGEKAMNLRNELIDEADLSSRCQMIENFLVGQLITDSNENKLIAKILLQMKNGDTLSVIRQKVGLSQRGLYSLFERRIGVRPKTFARIERFATTLDAISADEPLSKIAADKGFSDQAHFSREFQTFAGYTPREHQPIANENRHARTRVGKLFKTSDSE